MSLYPATYATSPMDLETSKEAHMPQMVKYRGKIAVSINVD